jgi:formylglycine-generating enzyme required for sulfatase activity
VGLKKPNRWGLYDVHGNVWEWCSDPYNKLSRGDAAPGATMSSHRVYRGGCWWSGVYHCKPESRRGFIPSLKDDNVGFRLALATVADLQGKRTDKTFTRPVETPPPPAVAPFDAEQANAHQKAWADYLGVPVEKEVELPGEETIHFMLIPPGRFEMGTSEANRTLVNELMQSSAFGKLQEHEIEKFREEVSATVSLGRPFYLSKHEVTVGQFSEFVSANSYEPEVAAFSMPRGVKGG